MPLAVNEDDSIFGADVGCQEEMGLPKITYASPEDPLVKTFLIRSIERLTGQLKIERMYDHILNDRAEDMSFWEAALKQLPLRVEYDERQLAKIPLPKNCRHQKAKGLD